ncbi:MAG TPA: hypothetical protein VFC54_10035 [Pseudolabrys sp.]|nr:hypothetical protein [Pseudolabrys sp.]
MTKSFRSRRSIALIAAYVIALQAVLLPLAVAAGGPFANSLCVTASSQASAPAGQDISHGNGCLCAAGCGMQCCAQALNAAEPDTFLRVRSSGYAMFTPLHPVAMARAATRSPLIPRAPPAG